MSIEDCEKNPHKANSLVLGKDHCGFCYDTVMNFREQLADSLEEEIEDAVLGVVDDDNFPSNDGFYRANHKIKKLIRGD